MTETEEPTRPGEDARDAARESAGRAAEEEGSPREGDERQATGNPAADDAATESPAE
jgi:hypothetical protein